MLDREALDFYIVELLDRQYQAIDNDVKERGWEPCLEYELKTLDCTRLLKNGQRAIQSIDFTYAAKVTRILYIIDNYVEDENKEAMYDKFLEKHEANLKFEKDNPPVIYDKKNYSPINKTKKTKEKKDKTPKEPRQSAAKTKLALKAAKLNALSINLPIKKV